MTTVSLDYLIALVTRVRLSMFAQYGADTGVQLHLRGNDLEQDFVVPFMRPSPDAPLRSDPCGAFRYSWRYGNERDPWQKGTGGTVFQLLPQMPRSEDDLGLGGDIQPLVTISAGKYSEGDTGHFGRYAYVNPLLSDRARWIHYLRFMPLAMSILNEFAEQVGTLPDDLDWREDLSHLLRAA